MATKVMDIEEWVHRVSSTPADRKSRWLGSSPGGVAGLFGISRQAVHDAIKRDRMDALRLTREGKLIAIVIPDAEVDRYRRESLRTGT